MDYHKIAEALVKNNPNAPAWAVEMAGIYYSNILQNPNAHGEWTMRLNGVPGYNTLTIKLFL